MGIYKSKLDNPPKSMDYCMSIAKCINIYKFIGYRIQIKGLSKNNSNFEGFRI